jgi:hypothetical protein
MKDESRDEGDGAEAPEGVSSFVVTAALIATFCVTSLLIGCAYVLLWTREGAERPSRQFAERALGLRDRVSEVLQQPFDIAHGRAAERELAERALHEFAWVDRSRGIVRVPVEDVMTWFAGLSSIPRITGGSLP